MTNTVTWLMELADCYRDGCNPDRTNKARQALESELTRLLTPVELSKITDHLSNLDADVSEDLCAYSFRSGVYWAEEQHGIGGES